MKEVKSIKPVRISKTLPKKSCAKEKFDCSCMVNWVTNQILKMLIEEIKRYPIIAHLSLCVSVEGKAIMEAKKKR
jgi:hypothetical protein